MNPSNRNLIFHLVQNHRRVNSLSTLKLTELVADVESALAAAKLASASKDKLLREIAEKVLAGLALEKVADEKSPAPKASLGNAAPPAKTSVRTYSAEWELLENITLDHAGPIGLHMLKKLRIANPGVNPKSFNGQCEKAFGRDIASTIFGRFSG